MAIPEESNGDGGCCNGQPAKAPYASMKGILHRERFLMTACLGLLVFFQLAPADAEVDSSPTVPLLPLKASPDAVIDAQGFEATFPVDSGTWLKVGADFSPRHGSGTVFLMEGPPPNLADLFGVKDGEVIVTRHTGSYLPLALQSVRDAPDRFRLPSGDWSGVDFFLHLDAPAGNPSGLVVLPAAGPDSTAHPHLLGLFNGMIFGLGIFYVFLFAYLRFPEFGWLGLYALGMAGYNFVFEGYAWEALTGPPAWQAYWMLQQSTAILCLFAYLQFARTFLRLKDHFPGWNRVVGGFQIVNLGMWPLCMVWFAAGWNPISAETVHTVLAVAGILLSFGLGIVRARQGQRSAWIYLASFVLLFAGILSDSLVYYRIALSGKVSELSGTWRTFIADYGFHLGVTGEALLMAVAAVASIAALRQARDQARASTLALARETAELKNNYALDLERELAERTEEVQRQNVKLAERDALKSRFFADISHELRTPLTLIRGHLDDLRTGRHEEEPGRSAEALAAALRHTHRLGERIGELLDLAKLEAGQLRLQTRPVDLEPFIRAQSEHFRSLCRKKEITLKCIAATAPIPAIPLDEGKIQQVISNLLSNAMKFTPEGGAITIRMLSCGEPMQDDGAEKLVGFEVSDTGCGIPPEARDRVFERYFHIGGGGSGNPDGTGIGLALVRELTELHGGIAEVESEPGTGSRFRVWLPVGAAHLSPHEIACEAISPDAAGPQEEASSVKADPVMPRDLAQPTLLLVEDHAELRRWLRGHLAEEYDVLEAGEGTTGWELARVHRPALILSDISMPGQDGLSFLEAVRADPDLARTPFILLTARGEEQDKIAGLTARANDYLTKPIDIAELKLRVANLLEIANASGAPHSSPVVEGILEEQAEARDRQIEKLKSCLVDHLADPAFNVSELAAANGMSEATLRRRIEGATGMTAAQWMRGLRIESARELAKQQVCQTVSELAATVGFRSAPYFVRLFKAEFGMHPKELIRRD